MSWRRRTVLRAVGAPVNRFELEKPGSVSVFERTASGWRQRTGLLTDDADVADDFGQAVALSADGTTGLVGAHDDEIGDREQAGAAYVFGDR